MEGRVFRNMYHNNHSLMDSMIQKSFILGLLKVGLFEQAKKDISTLDLIRNDAAILYCASGPDDPELLQQFLDIGNHNPVHSAAENNKPRLLRYLIQLGFYVNEIEVGWVSKTPLDDTDYTQIAMLLLDAGAHCFDPTKERKWITELRASRESVRLCTIATMGALGKKWRDVSRIIGRAIWANRGVIKK